MTFSVGVGSSFLAKVQVPVNVTSSLFIVFESASHEVNVHVPLLSVSSYVVFVGCLAVTVAPSAYSLLSVGL